MIKLDKNSKGLKGRKNAMKKKIGIFYNNAFENDAEHTKEVFLNECSFFKLPIKIIRRDHYRCENVEYYFVNIEKTKRWEKQTFDRIYIPEKLKKETEVKIVHLTEKIKYNTMPSQTIIDMVLELKELLSNKQEEVEV